MIWLPVHLALWLLEMLVGAVLWLVGWPVIVTLGLRTAWRIQPSRFYVDPYGQPRMLFQWEPRWAWLIYGNDEDGVLGSPAFTVAHRQLPHWLRAVLWSAWRNPVNNLRFVWPFGIRIEPRRVRAVGNCTDADDWDGTRTLWSYAWQGAFAGVHVRTRYFAWRRPVITWRRVWRVPLPVRLQLVPWRTHLNARCGWKLKPRDVAFVPASDYRSKGCGTGLQLQFRGGPN